MSNLSDWLATLNKTIVDKKLTQRSVATNACISESYLSEILNGKKEPRLGMVITLFLAVGICPVMTLIEVPTQ